MVAEIGWADKGDKPSWFLVVGVFLFCTCGCQCDPTIVAEWLSRASMLIFSLEDNSAIALFSDLKQFTLYCKENGFKPIPIQGNVLDGYWSFLVSKNRKRATVDRHIDSLADTGGLDQSTWIALPHLVSHDTFEKMIGAQRLFQHNINVNPSQVDVYKLQSEVDSLKSYQQREEEIEIMRAVNKNKILHQIRDLRSKISALRTTKLKELLRLNADRVKDLFEKFEENGELARFLILEGYLDDTYYQYTSLFIWAVYRPMTTSF